MQLTNTFVGAIALLASSAWASPIQAEHELVARQHSATSASVTGFTVTRNATHVNYAATIQVNPDHPALSYTHATAGTDVPVSSGFWSNSPADPSLLFRFNRIPVPAPGYRLVLTDAHVVGSSISFSFISPAGDWAGTGSTVYTGPSTLTLS